MKLSCRILPCQQGSTLIEAMIAVFILTVGILAAMAMQINAIGASSTAMNRTEASNVAHALIETLHRLGPNDSNLTATSASTATLMGTLTSANIQTLLAAPNGTVTTFTSANIGIMSPMLTVPAGSPPGTVADSSGTNYLLAWAVQDQATSGTNILNKNVWVFMSWNTLSGPNTLRLFTEIFHGN